MHLFNLCVYDRAILLRVSHDHGDEYADSSYAHAREYVCERVRGRELHHRVCARENGSGRVGVYLP